MTPDYNRLRMRLSSPDFVAVVVLILLWALFFWRLLTPNVSDQASIVEGDFSSQFFSFSAYQYDRLTSGEIPLWNPYNNSGLPFVADTQSAAFYPPRLLAIGVSKIAGGWTYDSLQFEMAAHVLLYTLLMYIFVRRLTMGSRGSVHAGLISAIIAGYGGYLPSYPTLQLAVLESGIWLTLALLGILEATRGESMRWIWLTVAGLALGLSWMAGHPQTAWFSTYAVTAYLGFCVYMRRKDFQRFGWRAFVGGTLFIAALTIGLYAVQLLPGIEYLTRTARTALSFDAKGGGFPFQDVEQFLFPGVASFWSPLFVGITGLTLALIGVAGRQRDRIFWGGLAIIALGMSFGANSVIFHAAYNILPGLSYFRGQERAAYLVVNSLAILAGLGVIVLYNVDDAIIIKRVQRGLIGLLALCGVIAGGIFLAWLGDSVSYSDKIGPIFFSALIALATLLVFPKLISDRRTLISFLLVGLVLFELFSVNMDNNNWEPIPAGERNLLNAPPLVEQIRDDTDGVYRVDSGFGGAYDNGNAGTLYHFQELRGISPLFLGSAHDIIQRNLPAETAWEIFAVRYVLTDGEELPVNSELIGRDYPNGPSYNLHRLTDPRPFAHLVYDYMLADSDQSARELLTNKDFDPRTTAILNHDPAIDLPEVAPDDALAEISEFKPEQFTIHVATSEPAILTVAQVDYPGWKITVDGESVSAIHSYGALTAIPLEGGIHSISYKYQPISFYIGAAISLVTWIGLIILGIVLLIRRRKKHVIPE